MDYINFLKNNKTEPARLIQLLLEKSIDPVNIQVLFNLSNDEVIRLLTKEKIDTNRF